MLGNSRILYTLYRVLTTITVLEITINDQKQNAQIIELRTSRGLGLS